MAQRPKTTLSLYGGWLPSNPHVHRSFLNHSARLASHRKAVRAAHIDPVTKFDHAIKSDHEMMELFNQIFLQAAPENTFEDYESVLHALDGYLIAPPSFHITTDPDGNVIGEPIGVPIFVMLDLLSNTDAGYILFRKPAFNDAMKNLLNDWATYLSSPDSTKTLTDDDEGWFGSLSIAALEDKDRGDFDSTYICPDPDKVNRGFASWDDFFSREIQESARSIIAPQEKSLIVSACESTVFHIIHDVKVHDQFWLKAQKYSLYDMLGKNEDDAKYFTGGTVYQAFLSPQDYHRWRSPIDGKIVRAEVIPGTYYAVLPDEGAPEDDPDYAPGVPYGALIRSQPWLTQSATRAIICIQSDNEKIGTVAFIGVGMAEVSTCEITVEKGQGVKKGDELGMFHFGGSTHALVFGPKTKITFEDQVGIGNHIKVNSTLGQVALA